MLDSIQFIQNIGRFDTVHASPDFGELTLIYSENGRGKTTLCAILRSLAANSPDLINERRRLSATSEPKFDTAYSG